MATAKMMAAGLGLAIKFVGIVFLFGMVAKSCGDDQKSQLPPLVRKDYCESDLVLELVRIRMNKQEKFSDMDRVVILRKVLGSGIDDIIESVVKVEVNERTAYESVLVECRRAAIQSEAARSPR